MERLSKCPLCKSVLFLNFNQVLDSTVSNKNFIICKCSSCELLFTNPRPKEKEISTFYDYPAYYSHEDQQKNLIQFIYQKIKAINVSRKANMFESFLKKGRILDYGCGTGNVLKEMQKRDWIVAGIEPNDRARKIANINTKNNVSEDINALETNKKFDIISLFHVLEHIHDLKKTIKTLLQLLKKSGYLIIAIPNPESWDAIKYSTKWAGWDVPRHLYHFNHQSLATFASKFGLELQDIKPMEFDSYYVSMLSEQNINPKQQKAITYIKALINGFKSNQFGKKEENLYSSNIYIFRKKSEIF